MIKIDFHMHTVATASDAYFDFDMEVLKQYVSNAGLDAIAITNHNMFDLAQYNQIKDALDIAVYPGIEIDLEGGHLLLISDGDDLEDFSQKCAQVQSLIPTPSDTITVATLNSIYPELGKYILIPHYDKKPPIPDRVIGQLASYITAGEVNSPKKFIYCLKDGTCLVPVYFSDSRMATNLSRMPVRQTYLSCDEVRFSSIKSCLSDKAKVSLSPDEGKSLFKVFEDGQLLSTGLNVVLGERSSGKSYTLDKIHEEHSEFGSVKYIEQFSLVERDSREDEKKFDRLLKEKHSLLSRDYLEPLQSVVNDVLDVVLEDDLKRVADYVDSLVKHAKESERHDAFSRAKLFGEEEFQTTSQKNLTDLIASTKNLISNIEFKPIIEKHVSIDALKKLYIELMQEYAAREEDKLKKKWLNNLIGDIKGKLKMRTAATTIAEIDLYKIAMNLNKVSKFEKVVNLAKAERVIEKKSLQGFEVIAKSGVFEGAGELKKLSRLKSGFSDAYAQYSKPYLYLQELKKVEGLEEADFHKYFVRIEYKILNKDGFEVSGGERSEFNLLKEIEDAQKYDMLLIDEPESSFDNLFLKEGVNEIIKEIAKTMPVVLVTHNNTVGASIKPDYLLYTKKEVENRNVLYRVYSGHPTSKKLISRDGKELNTLDVTMMCLEAGEDTYNQRKVSYENLKN